MVLAQRHGVTWYGSRGPCFGIAISLSTLLIFYYCMVDLLQWKSICKLRFRFHNLCWFVFQFMFFTGYVDLFSQFMLICFYNSCRFACVVFNLHMSVFNLCRFQIELYNIRLWPYHDRNRGRQKLCYSLGPDNSLTQGVYGRHFTKGCYGEIT